MSSISAITGLTFPGMIEEPGCRAGKRDIPEPGVRARAQQPKVVGQLREFDGQPAQGPREADEIVVTLGHLEVVERRPQLPTCRFPQGRHHVEPVRRIGVDAGPQGGGAQVRREQPVGGLVEGVDGLLDGGPVGAELLTQPDGHGVLQMRAPRLDYAIELPLLGRQRLGQRLEGRSGDVPIPADSARRTMAGTASFDDWDMLT